MSVGADFREFVVDQLRAAGTVTWRPMFGGVGLYLDGLFFALIADDRLFLKVDPQSQEAFAVAGCEPFVYQAAGRATTMGYWTVPAEAMESPAMMQPWARLALAAALRARAAKASAAPRKARAVRAQTQAGKAARRK